MWTWTARKRESGVSEEQFNTIVRVARCNGLGEEPTGMHSRCAGDWLSWSPAELAGGVNRLNTPATEVERRGSGIGGGLQGKSMLRITPVVDELLPKKIQVHQTGPFEPATLELQSFQTAQLFLNINSAKVRRHLVAVRLDGGLVEVLLEKPRPWRMDEGLFISAVLDSTTVVAHATSKQRVRTSVSIFLGELG